MNKSGYPKKIEALYACLLKRGVEEVEWVVPIMKDDSILEWNNPTIQRPSRIELGSLQDEDLNLARRMLCAQHNIEMLSAFEQVVKDKLSITKLEIANKIS